MLITYAAGLWNIGVEGQIVMGAIAAAWVAREIKVPAELLIPLTMLAGVIALPIARFILRPIDALVQANRRLAEGDMEVRVHTTGSGELALKSLPPLRGRLLLVLWQSAHMKFQF